MDRVKIIFSSLFLPTVQFTELSNSLAIQRVSTRDITIDAQEVFGEDIYRLVALGVLKVLGNC